MIWPGRPNHDIEGWDLFSKNSGSREELKMVQDRILLPYFEWNISPPHPLSFYNNPLPLLLLPTTAGTFGPSTGTFPQEHPQ
jgi:hypothetical protein